MCGREYDVTLFQFGRVVRCDCGAGVSPFGGAADHPRRTTVAAARFLADAMLGRLARWLRLIGVDAGYEAGIEDRDLAARAKAEGRVVLTRDTLLPRRHRDVSCLLIESEKIGEQLAQVVAVFGIDWRSGAFSRCTRCNTPLGECSRDHAAGRVPARVLRAHERFAACPSCHRVYWRGSHADRMRAALERALGPTERGPG